MFKLISLIFRNVLRSRRRTLLTLASTAISLAILSLMVGIYQGFFHGEDVSEWGALRMITRHRVALVQPLPASYMQRIKAVPGVVEVSGYSWFQGVYKENKPEYQFARFAVDADRIFDIYRDFAMPPEQLAAFKRERTGCAVAEAIAKRLKIQLGDKVTVVGDIYPVTLELTVVAIFKHPENTDVMFFHREYLSEALPASASQKDMVGTYIMLADKPEDMPRIAKAIDTMYDNSPYPTRTESEKDFGASFLAFLGNLKLFMGAICAAVTFTILLVSANAISMSVRERTRETAIMRTLGYTPMEILQLILGEALVISVIGGVIGIGVAKVMAVMAASSGGAFPLPAIKWQGALVVIAVSLAVGILAALVPAYITSRKNVVESLRFTG